MRIAIIHDALCVPGGAERLALWMSNTFPEAPIFTSVYLPECTFPEFKNRDIRTLPFSKMIKTEKQFKLLLPLWLLELRNLKFNEFDLVLSSSTYLAKYIQPAKGVDHRAYIHAPFRLFWKPDSYTPDSLPTPPFLTPIINLCLPSLRKWDQINTKKISKIAVSCQNMAREVEIIYQRSSTIINPPVQISEYPVAERPGQYFLSVSRLISHKRVDLAVEACNRLKRKLIVVGDGPERKKLEEMAGDTIKFAGRITDNHLKDLYLNAEALIFPSHEDYGIVPLESQACGRPVLAFGQGGVLETVQEGLTGLYFKEQSVDSLIECIQKFDQTTFDPATIRGWISRFDTSFFMTNLREFATAP